MWKAAFVGALALTAAGIVPVSAGEKAATSGYSASAAEAAAIDAQMARAKASLNLRPDQERHWPRVATAVRAWALLPPVEQEVGDGGLVERTKKRASALAVRAMHAKRVVAAAVPLMRALDDDQRQTAQMMVRMLGFGHLVATAM